MKYIKKFENYSTDYYTKFNRNDFPKELEFIEPKSIYKYKEKVLLPNSVQIFYELDTNQTNKENSYLGDIPNIITLDFSVTYDASNNKNTNCFIKIISGSQLLLDLSYKDGEYKFMDVTKCILSEDTSDSLKKILKSYE